MSNLRVENFIVTVSIPMSFPIKLDRNMNLREAEEYLIKLEENEVDNHDAAVELAQARALLKIAFESNAELYAIERKLGLLKVCFVFEARENQDFFLGHFMEYVERSAVK